MYRVLIVEDDEGDFTTLKEHLQRYARTTGEQFRISWLKTAMDFIQTNGQHDLIFMDIELPGINGLEATHLLRAYNPQTPVVFVTNCAQYATQGYEVDALDFMIKPVSYGTFTAHIGRIMRELRRNEGTTFVISTRDGIRVIRLSDVAVVEVKNHDLTFRFDNGEELEARGRLADVEAASADGPLVRISKSCLVNMRKIASVQGPTLVMVGGERLSLSRSIRREAIATITEYLGGSL